MSRNLRQNEYHAIVLSKQDPKNQGRYFVHIPELLPLIPAKDGIRVKNQIHKWRYNGDDKYFINMINGSIMDSMHVDCFAKYANDAEGYMKSDFKNNAKIGLDEDNNVCIIAKRNIKSGVEIFCGYGKEYWKKHG